MAYRSRLDHKSSSSSSTCRARREKLAVFALLLLGTSVSCSPHLFNHWCGTELGLLGVWSATQRACVVREGLQLLKLPPCIYLYVLLYFVVFSLCAFVFFLSPCGSWILTELELDWSWVEPHLSLISVLITVMLKHHRIDIFDRLWHTQPQQHTKNKFTMQTHTKTHTLVANSSSLELFSLSALQVKNNSH